MQISVRLLCLVIVGTILISSCEETVYTPKPRGFPKVVYPEKRYQQFKEGYCDFTFEYPTYANVEQDQSFFEEQPIHPCWFDLYVPDFDSRIYFSYIPIDVATPFDKLREDAFRLTDFHNKKATYIDEFPINKPNGVKGMLFKVDGPVGSPMQFFLTDSLNEKHFLRGALYFNTQARPDSLAPVLDFMEKDVEKLLETFEWKEG